MRELQMYLASDLMAAKQDRRQRLLELTASGVALERRLSESQRRRFADAYRNAGAEAVEGYRKVLMGMISEEDRERVFGPKSAEDE